jgi:L-gulonolactone oxidase
LSDQTNLLSHSGNFSTGLKDGPVSAVIDITCENDIVRAVLAAREGGYSVRAIGARGAKNDSYKTDGVTLKFDRYNQVIAFNDDSVKVQAGITIGELNKFLSERGKIIPTCGEWQGATIAGSIVTGAHGGSVRHGIHATSCLSVRLITANGETLDIGRGDPNFDHAVVSMGLFGVVSTITLTCENAFYLKLETRMLPFEQYVRDHTTLNSSAEFFAAIWFPVARLVQTFSSNRVPPQATTEPRIERFSIKTLLLDTTSRYTGISAIFNRRLNRSFIDRGHRILCPIPDRSKRVQWGLAVSRNWKAMEAALPLSFANEALMNLDKLLNSNRRTMLNAVGLRTSPADNFTISPCHNRDTLWIDLTFRRGNSEFAEELCAIIETFQGRCHWAKHIGLSASPLGHQYPKLSEFRRLREVLDPNGMFCNSFTRSIDL